MKRFILNILVNILNFFDNIKCSKESWDLEVERVKEKDAIIVCDDVIAMRERAYIYGIVGLNIISYEEYCRTPSEQLGKDVYIHNVNDLLKRINPNTKGYSVCNE